MAKTEAIVIGASVGAVEALSAILPQLPKEFPVPLILVVHVPPDRESVMAPLFEERCQIRVKEAEDKEPVEIGTAYFAPPDYHLLVEPDGRLSLSNEDPVLFSRPSIDVLFESAAEAYGPAVMGVILTGASADGAAGLRTIVEAGGRAVVQDPRTALGTAMPKAAIEACPEACVLGLADISPFLRSVVTQEGP